MRQQTLFTAAAPTAPAVPGLTLRTDYVDADMAARLVALVDAGPWSEDFRRRVQVYGLGLGEGETAWVRDFPGWLAALGERLVGDGWLPRRPDNCVVNDYAPGVGIGPHRDDFAFDEPVVALSLLSDVVIDFSHAGRGLRAAVPVPARSLWRVAGPARWQWTHGIATRRADIVDGERRPRERRVSLTFRLARAWPA